MSEEKSNTATIVIFGLLIAVAYLARKQYVESQVPPPAAPTPVAAAATPFVVQKVDRGKLVEILGEASGARDDGLVVVTHDFSADSPQVQKLMSEKYGLVMAIEGRKLGTVKWKPAAAAFGAVVVRDFPAYIRNGDPVHVAALPVSPGIYTMAYELVPEVPEKPGSWMWDKGGRTSLDAPAAR
jgi:hypothetical protein